jgi:hypothetical protein
MAYLPYQNEPMLLEALEQGPADEYLEEASDRIADIVGTSPARVRSQALANLARFIEEQYRDDPRDALYELDSLDPGLLKWIGRMIAAKVLPDHPITEALAAYDRGEISKEELRSTRDRYVGEYSSYTDLSVLSKLIVQVELLIYSPKPYNLLSTLNREKIDIDLMATIVESINTYPPVTKETKKKERRMRDYWGVPEGLSKKGQLAAETIKQFLRDRDDLRSGRQQVFMSPEEWLEHQGEKTDALLVILHDGGSHRKYFDPDDECYSCIDAMNEALAKIGVYTELGNSWYSMVWY